MLFPLNDVEAVWLTGRWNLLFAADLPLAVALSDLPVMVVRKRLIGLEILVLREESGEDIGSFHRRDLLWAGTGRGRISRLAPQGAGLTR